ncbi:MAG: hypothetical protein AAF471_08465, partial [Myxococcota bacterium]
GQKRCVGYRVQQNSASWLALWVTPQQVAPIRERLYSLGLYIENVMTYSLCKEQERAAMLVRSVAPILI